MTKRYYYSADLLTKEELKAAFDFAKSLLNEKRRLHIFINVKRNGGDLLKGMFDVVSTNKMLGGTPVEIDGVTTSIESIQTFDKFKEYDVALVIHGAESLLNKFEDSGRTANLVVFVNDIDTPTEWLKNEHNVLSAG